MNPISLHSWPSDPSLCRERLAAALPPDRLSLFRMVAHEADERSLPLYIVGGFVRDLLLGRPATDADLLVEGDAIAFAHSLAGKYGGRVTGHNRFGTAVWELNEATLRRLQVFTREDGDLQREFLKTLDITSARSETYEHPAVLPTVRRSNLADDLRRRDFTINTLALRLDGDHFGELRDDLGGLADLHQRVLRLLHPRSFVDDPTRIFRLVRYEQRLGFLIDAEALALIPAACPLLKELSAERLRHELDLILAEENPASMLGRLADMHVLTAAHPALTWGVSVRERLEMVARVPVGERIAFGWLLWLMGLSRLDLEQIEDRLHFKAGLRENLFSASRLYANLGSLVGKTPAQCVAILDEYPLLVVRAVSLTAPESEACQKAQTYLETWWHTKPITTGQTLKQWGLQPGPAYQKILWELRAAWLDGNVETAAQETALLEKLVGEVRRRN